MFVGETGIARVVERTCRAMRQAGIDDPTDIDAVRRLGVIDLPMIQKKASLHFSLTLDLFGNEISTNAANAFTASLKGRYREAKIADDHRLLDATYAVLRLREGAVTAEQLPALSALNMRLRDDYVDDCNEGVRRWNKVIERSGFEFRLRLPHVAFNRRIGEFAPIEADPGGRLLDAAEWARRREEFLPSTSDNEYLASLMRPVREPGAFAGWIAPPKAGIDNRPGDFEYVKIEEA